MAVLLLLLLLGVAGSGHSSEPPERVRLQLKWHHQFQSAGYYAAVEKGFYREAGLEVEIIPAVPSEGVVATVTSGQADFGVGTTDLLLSRHAGMPVVVLASVFQHSPLAIMAPAGSGIREVRDLAGRRLMLEPESAELLAFLQRQQLEGHYERVPHTFTIDALREGRVDAMSVYVTDEPYQMHAAGAAYLLFRPFTYGIDFYGDNLFTTESQIRTHPERVRAFRSASLRGWAYAMAHPEEIARVIHQRYAPNHSVEQLLFEAEQMRNLVNAELVEPGYMNTERWQRIAHTYAEVGMLPTGFPLRGFLYDPAQPVDLTRIYVVGGVLVLMLLAGGSAMLYVARLNRRLRASEERYRVVYEYAPLAFMVWDTNRRITDWNRQAERSFGWRRAEVIGRDFLELLVAEESRQAVTALTSDLMAMQGEVHSLSWNVTRAGQRIQCEWMNTVLRDEFGRATAVMGLALDVTDRKRLEQELRASEEKYRTILEAAPFPIFVTRAADNTLVYGNRRAEERFGITFDEGAGRPAPISWVHPEERERMYRLLHERGRLTDFEACLKDHRQEPMWVYLSACETRFNGEAAALIAFNEITERKRMENALRESEQRFRLLAENAYDVIWTLDLTGHVTYVSPSVERLRGLKVEEAIGETLEDVLAPGSLATAKEGFDYLLKHGEVQLHQWELEVRRKDGSTVWTEIIVNPLRDAQGNVTGLIGITRDIDEQRRIREELKILVVAIESAADAVVITDPAGKIEYVNPAFTAMTGYAAPEVVGQSPRVLKSGRQGIEFYRELWGTIRAGEVWRGEIVNRRKDATLYTEQMAIAPVKDAKGRINRFVAIKHDVSHRKDLEERLARLAHFDPLTTLPNRALFFDRLDRALAEARRYGDSVGLLFIDLDGFKQVNDELGHAAGDLLLQEVAGRFRSCVREADTVARVGGDEFTIILTRLAQTRDASVVADKLIAALQPRFEIGGGSWEIGASIGISLCPDDACDAAELLRHSDDAMYEVKRRGKNGYAFYTTLNA